LIASPAILLLDEPTSGLDSSIAYEVVSTIRDLAKTSKGALSIILTIHQPNSRILSLFDHLLLLEQGSSTFFGSLLEANQYFSRLGYHCPKSVTPTDYYLQITDSNFLSERLTTGASTSPSPGGFDFSTTWTSSPELGAVKDVLSKHEELCLAGKINTSAGSREKAASVPFWRQVYVLIYRDYMIAYRDPTLYYFQAALLISFSFLTGAVFWMLPTEVNGNFNIFPSALLWLVFFHTWVHAFKVFHLSASDQRAQHEIYNGKYSPLAAIVADIISVSSLAAFFLPVPPIAYFMMGFPAKAYPFMILLCWLTGLSGEAMIALITKLSTNPTTAMVYCQITLVSLQVFGGGVFLPWKDCPDYWVWLQEMTIFAQSSRAMNMEVFAAMDFDCQLASDGKCYDPSTGVHYGCDSYSRNGTHCLVNGREMLAETQGISRDMSYWYYFGYLCAIYVGLKLGIAFFTYLPYNRIHYWLLKGLRSSSSPSTPSTSPNPGASGLALPVSSASPSDVIPIKKQEISRESSFHKSSPTLGLVWSNYSVILAKNGAKLVDDVTGCVASGRILAMMGPSGAGKTTLLNGLSNRAPYAKLVGEVKFGGRAMTPQDLTYVPQFDEVNDVLTVYEHIRLVGMLTCADKAQMLQRAEELLEVLGLTKKRDVQVRGLSGGEIKRLSVGIGLISNPNVLFLDEPTTGLDSTAAFSIVQYLSIVAKATNVAVIMTLHQPSGLVFDMLDDLLLLESGKVVYAGSIPAAAEYFASIGYENPASINPADYYLDLALNPPAHGGNWSELYAHSSYSSRYKDKVLSFASYNKEIEQQAYPSFISRFVTMSVHFSRYFLIEPGYVRLRLVAIVILSIFEGTLFLNLQPDTENLSAYVGAMFTAAIAVMLTAISPTSLYSRDRREAVDRVKNGFYSPGIYVASQFLISAVYDWFLAFVFVSIFHWLTNINPNKIAFIYHLFISWGHIMLIEGALMILIEVLKNEFLATTSGMIFIGSCMLFAGYFRQVDDIPASVNWLCFVVPLRVCSPPFRPSLSLPSPPSLPVLTCLLIDTRSGPSMGSHGKYFPLKVSRSRGLVQRSMAMTYSSKPSTSMMCHRGACSGRSSVTSSTSDSLNISYLLSKLAL
jgi:ATP-binding cassette, subfamily G (WHITE), member 2, SNQ2